MKQPIAIFGTGGLAKELVGYLDSERPGNPWEDPQRYEVMVAVSTDPWNNPRINIPVIHEPDDVVRQMQCLMAIADPAGRRQVVERWPGLRWLTYIHRSALVSPYAIVGIGSVLTPQVIITSDAVVGKFAFLNTNATVGHDSTLGDYVTLGPNSEVCGNCEIGDECYFGIGAYCVPHVNLPAGTKVSAGAVVRGSIMKPTTLYGDPAKPRLKAV